jgi:ribonuclease HII
MAEIGIDEAGMGPIAGPMVIALVALPDGAVLPGVRDSKKLTDNQRENLIDLIVDTALYWDYVIFSSEQIDNRGLGQCWKAGMVALAQKARKSFSDEMILDGNKFIGLPYVRPVIKADDTVLAVSAASILAKFAQSDAMDDYHKRYPQYGFNKHRGYLTAEHQKSLQRYGPCLIHRVSTKPVKNCCNQFGLKPIVGAAMSSRT